MSGSEEEVIVIGGGGTPRPKMEGELSIYDQARAKIQAAEDAGLDIRFTLKEPKE